VAGITQYDHIKGRLSLLPIIQPQFLSSMNHFSHLFLSDKPAYFERTPSAYALQSRWRKEAGIDILQRVASKLRETTQMTVQVACQEDGKEYYAGILRAVDAGMHVHADFAPYVSSVPSNTSVYCGTNANVAHIGGSGLVYQQVSRATYLEHPSQPGTRW
jgi:hypothetical protein